MLAGTFAASDAVVTALEGEVPFWLFALLGGPKIPLQMAWQVALGARLLRGEVAAPAPR